MYMICSLMIEVQTCGMSIYEFFFFKQKTAYEMRISDWSSDVCSTDLHPRSGTVTPFPRARRFPDRHATSPGAPDNSAMPAEGRDRQSVGSGKSVSVRVDIGGRRIINTQTTSEMSLVTKT